jgi:phosphoesterase RecJ-like protein
VAHWIHGRKNVASVRLLGEALRTLELLEGGRVASLHVDEEAFQRSDARPEDTEEIINHPRAMDGVRAVAFFKQWEPGVVRVSLRSKGTVDVRQVAAQFGGGGHNNASGCTVNGSLEEVRQMILAAVSAAVEDG